MSWPIPSCLADAYNYLGEDRAFVVCIPVQGGGVATLASNGKCQEVLRNPAAAPFVDPRTPNRERAEFLLGGIGVLADALL